MSDGKLGQLDSAESLLLKSKRTNSGYDPMKRANNFVFDVSFQDELLSEFDTDEAKLLRMAEEQVFDIDDCASESYMRD